MSLRHKFPSVACIIDALKIALKNNISKFGKDYYIQLNGTTMGPQYGPVYTDIAMSLHDGTLHKLLKGKVLSLNPNNIPNRARVNPECDINDNKTININNNNNNSNANINSNEIPDLEINDNGNSLPGDHEWESDSIGSEAIFFDMKNGENGKIERINLSEFEMNEKSVNGNNNSNGIGKNENRIDEKKRKKQIISELKKKGVNYDKLELDDSDSEFIDDYNLTIDKTYLKSESIKQIHEFVDNIDKIDNINSNAPLISVINKSMNDNTKIEFMKILKDSTNNVSDLSLDEKYTYNNKGEITGINYNNVWKNKMDANFRFQDDLNIMGYLGTIEEFKQEIIPKLKNQYLEMDFKVDQHGIKVDYLNATIIFDLKTNLIKVCSFSKETNTHSYVHFSSMHQMPSFKACIETLTFMARCLNDDSTFATVCAKEAKCLSNRGYPLDLVFKIMNKYQNISQQQALKIGYQRKDIMIKNKNKLIKKIAKLTPTSESSLQKPIYLIYRHHVIIPNPKLVVLRLAKILEKDPLVKALFPMPIWQFGYKRDRNLKDAVTVAGREMEHLIEPLKNAGNYKCAEPKCKMCKIEYPLLIHRLKEFRCKSTGIVIRILSKLNCQTTWCIYNILCNDCIFAYVGSTETSVHKRVMGGHLSKLKSVENLNLLQIDQDKYSQSPLLKHAKLRCKRCSDEERRKYDISSNNNRMKNKNKKCK